MLNNCGYERMAILVDGGFYRRRAFNLFGDKTPQERANELITYCMRHIKDYNNDKRYNQTSLYRIFTMIARQWKGICITLLGINQSA